MADKQRIIAHFDLDAFFVSVECLLRPELRGKPLLVGGRSGRGVVAACSYEARAFGIHSAMPMSTAMRLCPHAIVVGSTRGEYSRYSRLVTEIISAKAPVMEKASVDEFYIDLTGMDKFFKPFDWTIQLRQEIIETTGLAISFGLASNKLVAKIATDEAKPNGYLQVLPGREEEFLAPLRVNKIPGVGEQTFNTLRSMGIETIADLAKHPAEALSHRFGRYGAELQLKAKGIHDSPVEPYHEAKSVSTENTFENDSNDEQWLMDELVRMTERVAFEVRKDKKYAGCIAVKIRYHDFETTSKQISIPYTYFDDELIPLAKNLFAKLYRKGHRVRLLGVRLSELTNESIQTSLFSDRERKDGLYKAIDDVKNRFGTGSISKASGK